MTYTLRPYQSRCLQDCINYIEDKKNTKKVIVIAPMGSGKSLLIASVANYIKEPVIVLSPNKELLSQNREKLLSFGQESSIFSASMGVKELGKITFATIGSISSQVQRVKQLGVKLLLVDECALATKHGSKIANFINETGIQKVIGYSAAPVELGSFMRQSFLKMINRSRKNLFQDIIHCTQVKEIVDGGFWSKMVYEDKHVDTSKLRLNSSGADYTEQSMKVFYEGNSLKSRITNEVMKLQSEGRKSILVFVPSIYEANELSTLIPGSYAVSSLTPQKQRDAIVQGFKNLQIPVAINVNIFSYGFDNPQLDAVVTGRPTNSFSLYMQQGGRGVRPHVDKKDCIISDFSGNFAKFGKLEDIEFRKNDDYWAMYSGQNKLTIGKMSKDEDEWGRPIVNKDIPFDGRIWFGQTHKGKLLSECPTSYLQWLIKDYRANSLRDRQMLAQAEQILAKN